MVDSPHFSHNQGAKFYGSGTSLPNISSGKLQDNRCFLVKDIFQK